MDLIGGGCDNTLIYVQDYYLVVNCWKYEVVLIT